MEEDLKILENKIDMWNNYKLKNRYSIGDLEDEINKENKAIQHLVQAYKDQQAELEKKDKIIDEMAGYIATLDIEEDICSKTENEYCDKMNFGECEDCIKQYFERKVNSNK